MDREGAGYKPAVGEARATHYDRRMRRFAWIAALLILSGCTFGGGGFLPSDGGQMPRRIGAQAELDVPYVPTPRPVVAAMLDMAELTAGDYLIDLGSGDGRIAIEAARRGARALGVDIDPARVEEAENAARLAGIGERVRFRRQDLFATPLREASVIALYLLPEVNLRLRPRLLTELRPGTRIVSHAFDMGEWRPDQHRVVDGANVYLWIVPAVVGGEWLVEEKGASPMHLRLDQRFQDAWGTLDGRQIGQVSLAGRAFSFTTEASGATRVYRGEVGDRVMEGAGWRARRID
jgi:SAM-dependent methyltransferase